MHNMVNYVKDHLQSELVGKLYKFEEIENLMKESQETTQKREKAETMLKVRVLRFLSGSFKGAQVW